MSFVADVTHGGWINRATGLNMSSSMYLDHVKNFGKANENKESQNMAPHTRHNTITSAGPINTHA